MIKNRNVKIIGLILIVLGTLFITIYPYTLFFYYIPLIILILGLIILWLSNNKSISKIIWTLVPFLFYIIYTYLWTIYNTVPPETFLIPENYRGKVNIIYNDKCGKLLDKTDKGYVYEIPNDGILLLSNKQKFGFINQEYYLVDKKGNRTKLPKMDVRDFNEEWTLEKNPNEPSRNKLGIFNCGTTGVIGETINVDGNSIDKFKECTFQEFYISTYNDLKNKFQFKYELKFDSIRNYKLKEYCN